MAVPARAGAADVAPTDYAGHPGHAPTRLAGRPPSRVLAPTLAVATEAVELAEKGGHGERQSAPVARTFRPKRAPSRKNAKRTSTQRLTLQPAAKMVWREGGWSGLATSDRGGPAAPRSGATASAAKQER